MIYLNNATTGFPHAPMALQAFEAALKAPPADTRHAAPGEATLPKARNTLAHLLGVSKAHLFFTPDATTGINAVLRGRLSTDEGHCVVDNRAHNAVTRALFNAGLRWSYAPVVRPDESLDREALLTHLPPETTLVSLTHASNVTGSVYDLAPLIRALKVAHPEVEVLVDACQSAGVVDLSELLELADFMVFSGHKFLHAPQGASVLVAKKRLKPLLYGGTGVHSERLSLDHHEEHFVEIGTLNLPAIQGLVGAIRESFYTQAAYQLAIQERVVQLWAGLEENPMLVPLGRPPGSARTGVIACATLDSSPEVDWLPMLRKEKLVVRGGLHCAPKAHHDLGHPEGTLRLSLSRFTSPQEIDDALQILSRVAKALTRAKKVSAANEVSSSPSLPPAKLRFTIQKTLTCAELAGNRMLEGHYELVEPGEPLETLRAKGWTTATLGEGTRFGARDGAFLYLYEGGEFSLAHVSSKEAGALVLAELGQTKEE